MCSNSPSCPAYIGHGNDNCFCGVNGYCSQVFGCVDCLNKKECDEQIKHMIFRIKYLLKGGDYQNADKI